MLVLIKMNIIKGSHQLRHFYKFSSVTFSTLNTARQTLKNLCNYRNGQNPYPTLTYQNQICKQKLFSTSSKLCDNYEGDGKTTVTILNREYKHLVMIDTYSRIGFRMNNGIYAIGPLAVFPRTILHWNVNSIEDLSIEAFSLFCLLDPKIDILILGTGDTKTFPKKEILAHLKSFKISVEILSTDKAVSLFNFLNAEGRCVAGALIPPSLVTAYDEELKIMETVEAIDDMSIRPHNKKLS